METPVGLGREIAACRICVESPKGTILPHEPRPVVVLSSSAKIRIIGQAPGTRVHASGRPFTDPSGDRLRQWMGVDDAIFYDSQKIAITPMGFCFPGLDAKGGDLPPRKECAEHWHDRVDALMPQIELVLLIGQYAQHHYLKEKKSKTLTETVKNWREIMASGEGNAGKGPVIIPLPHPSWRNNGWIRKNPWFTEELLPELQTRIEKLLKAG